MNNYRFASKAMLLAWKLIRRLDQIARDDGNLGAKTMADESLTELKGLSKAFNLYNDKTAEVIEDLRRARED